MKTIVIIVSILILVGIVVKNFLARRKEMRAFQLDNLVKSVREGLEKAKIEVTKDTSKNQEFGAIEISINGRLMGNIPLEELEEINRRLNTFLGTGRGIQEYVPGQKFIPPSQKIDHARREERAKKDSRLREKAKNAMKENKERW